MPKHRILGDTAYIERGELPNVFSSLFQRLQDLVHSPEYTTDDMKDFDKFQRLREDRKLAFLDLRIEMEQYRAEQEDRLAQVWQALGDLDYAQAMVDSFQGGPGTEGERE